MLRRFTCLGFALATLAAPAAEARTRADCLANGFVVAGAFVAQPAMTERGLDSGMIDYAVHLRATRPLHTATASLPLGGRLAAGVEVELPMGQEVLVRLGRRPAPRATEAELRAALRVTCQPA